MQTLRGLKKAGLVEFSEREVLRVSRYDDAPAREDIVLNSEQQAAFDGLCTLLGRAGGSAALLHLSLIHISLDLLGRRGR